MKLYVLLLAAQCEAQTPETQLAEYNENQLCSTYYKQLNSILVTVVKGQLHCEVEFHIILSAVVLSFQVFVLCFFLLQNIHCEGNLYHSNTNCR